MEFVQEFVSNKPQTNRNERANVTDVLADICASSSED